MKNKYSLKQIDKFLKGSPSSLLVLSILISTLLSSIIAPIIVIELTKPKIMHITSAGRITNSTAEISIYTDTKDLSSNRVEIYAIVNNSKIMQRVITSEILRYENPLIVSINLDTINQTFSQPFNGYCFSEDKPDCFSFKVLDNYSNEYYPLRYIIRCIGCDNKDEVFTLQEMEFSPNEYLLMVGHNLDSPEPEWDYVNITYEYKFWKYV